MARPFFRLQSTAFDCNRLQSNMREAQRRRGAVATAAGRFNCRATPPSPSAHKKGPLLQGALHSLCATNYGSEIASQGQVPVQAPHSMQSPSLTSALPSSILIAPTGHASTHVPHPPHFSLSTIAAMRYLLMVLFLSPVSCGRLVPSTPQAYRPSTPKASQSPPESSFFLRKIISFV